MKVLKILDWPEMRYYGETHPFHKWKKQFRDNDIKVEFFVDHQDKKIADGDYFLIHSRYFADGWQNLKTRSPENQAALFSYLEEMKGRSGKLIWFDAADSTGSGDFAVTPYVDLFLKKQLLKNKGYYTADNGPKDLRLWLNSNVPGKYKTQFDPCPPDQIHKVKLGWNIGLNDYRYFGYKMSRLSNYLSYGLYPLKYSEVDKKRCYDLTFRGTIHQDNLENNRISYQRNYVLGLFEQLKLNIARGHNVSKSKYWKELRNSKLSVSPFGWGEICYRDFETFISGAVLIKPSLNHLVTFPDSYIPEKTYVQVAWDMRGTQQLLEQLIANYNEVKQIGRLGQETYKQAVNDAQGFIDQFKRNIQ